MVSKSFESELLYCPISPTKAEFIHLYNDEEQAGASAIVDFSDVTAPGENYFRSFLDAALAYDKGHVFTIEDIETIPHWENPFIFYPANLSYTLPFIHAMAKLGLFVFDREAGTFSIDDDYHNEFKLKYD